MMKDFHMQLEQVVTIRLWLESETIGDRVPENVDTGETT